MGTSIFDTSSVRSRDVSIVQGLEYVRETSATHCGKHRVDGSFNVTMMCVFPGCTSSPSYGVNHYTKAESYAIHKIEGDVATSRETCSGHGCPKRPGFVDTVGNTKHCLEHYNPGADVGILYVMCQGSLYVKHATFSETKNRPLPCLKHKCET